MGYGNLTIRREFPDLQASDDDKIWIVFRNPKVVPQSELGAIYAKGGSGGRLIGAAIKAALDSDSDATAEDVAAGVAEGIAEEGLGDGDVADLFSAGDRMLAHLVIASRIYDPTVLPKFDENGNQVGEYEPVLLPSKLRPEDVAKLPGVIKDAVNAEFASANPRRTPASQEATGNQS